MKKTKHERENSAPNRERATSKRRRRKRQYTEQIYGARPAYEDARVIDDYASRNGLDRAEVVRKALHLFALRQGVKYPVKDPLQEMQEKVFRDFFAQLFERLEAISETLRELPQEVGERHAWRVTPEGFDAHENGKTPSGAGAGDDDFAALVASTLREQQSAMEQVLLTSTFALRLLVNFVIDPQLRHLNPTSVEPYLRAAELGTSSWSAPTTEVMKRTGKKIVSELKSDAPKSKSGTPDASQGRGQRRAATLNDSEIATAL